MNFLSSIFLDAPIILSLILCSVSGWKKGAVRPFVNFLGSLFSASVSAFLSFHISKILYNSFLRNLIYEKIHSVCLSSNVENFPKYFMLIFNICKVNSKDLCKIMYSANPEGTLLNIISPFVINSTRIIIGSILFGIIMYGVRKISKISSLIFKAPVLSQFNSILGALFGAFKGALFSWVCILFLHISLVYWNNPPKIFSQSSINSTSVFVKFYNFNPITNKFMNNMLDICELDFSKWMSNRR